MPQVLSLALWDTNSTSFDAARLPPSADPQVSAFFRSDTLSHARSSSEWFDLCSARDGLRYISGSGNRKFELYPSAETFVDALESFVGIRPAPPTHDGLAPLWPGCAVGWRLSGTSSRKLLLVQRLDGPSAESAIVVGSDVVTQRLRHEVSGATGHRLRATGLRATEVLRIVFHSEVHCYALRSLICDEPGWLDGCRRLWLDRWRQLHGMGVGATGRDARGSQGGGLREARLHALPAGQGKESVAATAASGLSMDELVAPGMHLVLAVLLGRQLLQVQAHEHGRRQRRAPADRPVASNRRPAPPMGAAAAAAPASPSGPDPQRTALSASLGGDPRAAAEAVSRGSAASIVLAVAAAAPYDYQERLQVRCPAPRRVLSRVSSGGPGPKPSGRRATSAEPLLPVALLGPLQAALETSPFSPTPSPPRRATGIERRDTYRGCTVAPAAPAPPEPRPRLGRPDSWLVCRIRSTGAPQSPTHHLPLSSPYSSAVQLPPPLSFPLPTPPRPPSPTHPIGAPPRRPRTRSNTGEC